MALIISPAVRKKLLEKHGGVTDDEILECFANRERGYVEDTREEHKTDPATLWFVAETDYGRKLKVVFIPRGEEVEIKTAYLAGEEVIALYKKVSK